MHILGIDTSSTDLSISLCINGSTVSTVNRYVRNSHAEHITLAVKSALSLGGINAEQITHVAISVGPGSFTGLRIGLSFVKGLCMMTERKVLPLSSLMILAHAASRRQFDSGSSHECPKIFTAIDARQGRVQWGSFIWDNNHVSDKNKPYLRRLTGDRLSRPQELLGELSTQDVLVTDVMGYSRSTVFDMFEGRAKIINASNVALTRGFSCATFATETNDESAWLPVCNIVPNYLQMSAAEEKKICN